MNQKEIHGNKVMELNTKKHDIKVNENNYNNISFNCLLKLKTYLDNKIIGIHLHIINTYKRALTITRKTLLIKSIEMETTYKISGKEFNNDINLIVKLCKHIIQFVNILESLNASAVLLYNIRNIIDKAFEENASKNNYCESSLDFKKFKTDLMANFEGYISKLKASRSNLNATFKGKIKNNKKRQEIRQYNNKISNRLDELISDIQYILSTINNSIRLEELLELKVNN